MTEVPAPLAEARQRLNRVLARASPLEREGFPFGSLALRHAFEEEVRAASLEGAERIVQRAGELLELADRAWEPLRRLLADFDDLRDLAELSGMDLRQVDGLTGNPRAPLLGGTVSAEALRTAARHARLGLATLREALPSYLVEQARELGRWARDARGRGTEVGDVVREVERVVRALHDLDLRSAASAVGNARHAVARTEGPARVPSLAGPEEEAILREAHHLARRLAHFELGGRPGGLGSFPAEGAPGTSDDRDGLLSPEDEIEALWDEVDRLVRDRELAATGPLLAVAGPALSVAPTVDLPGLPEPPVPPAEPILPSPEASAENDAAPVSPALPPEPLGTEPADDLLPEADGEPPWAEQGLPAGIRASPAPAGPEVAEPALAELGLHDEGGGQATREIGGAGAAGPGTPTDGAPGGPQDLFAGAIDPSRNADRPTGTVRSQREPRESSDGASERRDAPRWMSRISISAAYVPPESPLSVQHRPKRLTRPPARRTRSRHRK